MYKKIMVALDGSRTARLGLDEAIRLAKSTDAALHVVYIVDKTAVVSFGGQFDPNALLDEYRRDGRKALEAAQREMAAASVVGETEIAETSGMNDDIHDALERCARTCGADLVVMGTHGRRGVRRMVLGSVAERFLRVSHCPVLFVRDDEAASGAPA